MHEILERIGCGTRCGWVSEWVVSDAPGRRQHASRYEMGSSDTRCQSARYPSLQDEGMTMTDGLSEWKE